MGFIEKRSGRYPRGADTPLADWAEELALDDDLIARLLAIEPGLRMDSLVTTERLADILDLATQATNVGGAR